MNLANAPHSVSNTRQNRDSELRVILHWTTKIQRHRCGVMSKHILKGSGRDRPITKSFLPALDTRHPMLPLLLTKAFALRMTILSYISMGSKGFLFTGLFDLMDCRRSSSYRANLGDSFASCAKTVDWSNPWWRRISTLYVHSSPCMSRLLPIWSFDRVLFFFFWPVKEFIKQGESLRHSSQPVQKDVY